MPEAKEKKKQQKNSSVSVTGARRRKRVSTEINGCSKRKDTWPFERESRWLDLIALGGQKPVQVLGVETAHEIGAERAEKGASKLSSTEIAFGRENYPLASNRRATSKD